MKIAVGLSGGVDSSVTAHLLKSQGHEVIGIFVKTWDDADPFCPAAQDAADARMVAAKLDIPFFVEDFTQAYKKSVFEFFLAENRAGRTPNPDILCNRYVKFGVLAEFARELGAAKLATGHYARNIKNPETGLYELRPPADANKDQTYFLHALNQDQLSMAMFPLADLTKSEIREIAAEQGFVTATKKDSVGICMVGDRDYRAFLQKYIDTTPGDITLHETGQVLGAHTGLPFYTIGQRRDLYIGGTRNLPEKPFFVLRKDFEKNEIIVTQEPQNLEKSTAVAIDFHWIAGVAPTGANFSAQTRYRSRPTNCAIEVLPGGRVQVDFESPVRAISPGQSLVVYQNGVCLGGGRIA